MKNSTEDILKSFDKSKAWKIFRALYKGYERELIYSLFFYILKHSPLWIAPIVIANIVDLMIGSKEEFIHGFIVNGIVLVGVLIVHIPLTNRYMYYQSKLIRESEATLRLAISSQIQKLSFRHSIRLGEGVLHSKVMRDVTIMHHMAYQIFTYLPSAILSIIVAVTVISIKSPYFLIFFIITVPLIISVIRWLELPLRAYNKKVRKKSESISSILLEMIQLLPIIKAHATSEESLNRVEKHLNQYSINGQKLDVANNKFGAAIWVILRLFEAICLLVSAYCAYSGYLGVTVGMVILLVSYATTLTDSLMHIVSVTPEITKGFDSILSIKEILKTKEVEVSSNKVKINKLSGAVVFKNVWFSYDKINYTAKNINFKVDPGEVIGMVGKTGSGKSTILNLLIGFLQPDKGTISIDGFNLNDINLLSYRKMISVVAQDVLLFSGTIRENILFGLPKMEKNKENLLINNVLNQVGIHNYIKTLPNGVDTLLSGEGHSLSGGQKQQIAIARALIREPKILILDEASSALDAESEKIIEHAINYLPNPPTIFIVAHRLSTVKYTNTILVLQNGFIKEAGSHKELLEKNEVYANLWNTQVGVSDV